MKYDKEIGEWTTRFAIDVLKICSEMRKVNLDIDIITQFRKSGTSIGANVNEGKGTVTLLQNRSQIIKRNSFLDECY